MLGVKHRIGGFRVIAPIGAGGFATVYRALDEETGKEVAIKVLAENHSLVPDTRRRFEEEMGLLMTVKSPAIAKIYKVGETEAGQPFMVLELADRGDLRRRLEEIRGNHQVLNRDDLTMLAHHLYESLRHLHGMEIVHRDVSPGNILIRSRQVGTERAPGITLLEPGERFLLTDLGHAKDMILASGFTAGGGTRGFASPEQRDDVTVVDHRADIFAATAILEWAAHDGLYAEALDPFFDIGLAAEPDDRFDSMDEWQTSFAETMAATMLDGSQRSKVGRVIRRLTPGKTPVIDDIDLDALRPEMLLDDTISSRPPGGVTPPGMAGQAKVVRPPGSPGDQSIARLASGITRSGRPIDEEISETSEGDDDTDQDSAASDETTAKTEIRGASPLTRVDPEVLVDRLTTSKFDEPNQTRRRSRRLAFAVGTLVVSGMLAFGLAQELGNTGVSISNPIETTVSTNAPSDPAQTTTDEPIAEPLADTTVEPEQPADLFVAVDPDQPDSESLGEIADGELDSRFSSGLVEAGPEDGADGQSGEAIDPARPAVTISSPDQDQQLAIGALIITGTATAPEGIERVEVSIRNLDTLLYWDAERQIFSSDWATVTVDLQIEQNDGDADIGEEGTWSVTVPEEQLNAGDYQIRTWLKAKGSTIAPRNDSRTVTVLRPDQSE